MREFMLNRPGYEMWLHSNLRKGFILSIAILLFQSAYADKINISGYVYCDSTNAPVLFANVSIKGNPIGVSTNEAGEFSFHIPDKNANDTLMISAIGYASYICPIHKISKKDSIVVFLKEQIYELQNIVVFPENELIAIIQNATKKIRKNYPKGKYLLNGFYREMVLRDHEYTRLIEAAIDIQKQGTANPSLDLVRVNELRKSNSHIEYDWKSKLFKIINGERNQLYSLIAVDIINYHNQLYITKHIFTKDFEENYDFVMEEIKMIDSVRVYKIRFYDKKFYGEMEGDFSAIENHWIYVREDNYAVIKYDHKFQIVKNLERYKTINFGGDCIHSHTVSYKEYQGKYYPYLFESIRMVNAKYADEKTGKGKQYMRSILLINNIITRRSEFEKVKEKFSSPKDVDLYNQNYTYNPEFWSNYNILQLNPLYKQVKNDLEAEVTLEQQFVKNGQ